MSINFSSLEIEFSEDDKASVFYAHLQNVLKDLIVLHMTKKFE